MTERKRPQTNLPLSHERNWPGLQCDGKGSMSGRNVVPVLSVLPNLHNIKFTVLAIFRGTVQCH